jgi:hypothetical protein
MRRLLFTTFVVAVIAANLAAVRALPTLLRDGEQIHLLLFGLLPLLDAQLIGMYVATSRFLPGPRPRVHSPRGWFAPAFAAASSLLLFASLVCCMAAPARLIAYLTSAGKGINLWLQAAGMTSAEISDPVFRLLMSPLILWVMISGPPLLIATICGLIFRRFS